MTLCTVGGWADRTNIRVKKALIAALGQHIRRVEKSKSYYDKKRQEGKKHNPALRSLGRHMIRVIWRMIKKKEDYELA